MIISLFPYMYMFIKNNMGKISKFNSEELALSSVCIFASQISAT